jgi:hypothetical protein
MGRRGSVRSDGQTSRPEISPSGGAAERHGIAGAQRAAGFSKAPFDPARENGKME